MKKALTIILTALLVLSFFVACSGEAEDLFGKKITFNGNGSTSGRMADMKVKKGEEVTLPANAFEKTEHVFAGWNTKADGSGTAYANEGTAKFDKDTTLYAQWIEELTITFNANDGSETPATKTQKVGRGVETALDPNTFELSGFTFTKWNTKIDGSGTDYTDGAVKTFDSDLELYAQWSANTDTPYVVNHYTKDLTGDKYTLSSTDNKTATTGVSLILADLKKTIEGFTYSEGFAGTETKGTTKPSSGAVTEAEVLGEGNLVIDLYYSRDSHTVTLTKGSEADHISAITGAGTYAYGASVSVEATIDSGYKFANWTITDQTTEVSTANPYDFTMGASDVSYTANAAPITYTVTFDKNSTSATGTMANQSFTYDAAQNLTANAYSWESHSFTGWNTSSDGQGTSYADGASVSNLTTTDGATVTLYAQWLNGAIVTFNANGGSGNMAAQAIPFNTSKELNPNTFTAPEGKVFAGWTTDAAGEKAYYGDGEKVTLTEDLTLYAQWGIDLNNLADNKYAWENGKTYTITNDLTLADSRIAVSGTVKLFLNPGKTLTASKGITVSGDNSLTINGKGSLSAGGSGTDMTPDCAAGIGNDDGAGGNVIINGGTVTATGGNGAAGIGGGYYGNGGKVTINGGEVTANGENNGAGIGGGYNGNGGEVTINGGTVTATGGEDAAGIGGGKNKSGGTVTINGGTVTATGVSGGAGIGGGYYRDGGTVIITGGNVTAQGGDAGGAGIGAGQYSIDHGALTIGYAEIQTKSLVINSGWSLYYGDSENPTSNVAGPHNENDISSYVGRYMNVTQPLT